ncbi:CubicO group peptidase (beta-lactamase class C family) [Bradyrhizobium sp. GM5.1]
MKRREFLVGAALLAGTMARSRAADVPAPSSDGLDRITAYFDNEVTNGRLPGAVVLVQQHGKPVYLKTIGVRDTRTGLAMTPDTIFAIHSMTKPITCLGAMMLIDEGKLALTDPVSKYVPLFADTKVGLEVTNPDGTLHLDLVAPVRPVNIEDLLRHTSGISYDYIGGKWVEQAYKAANIFEGQFNNREFAERIARLPLARQPGTLWRYGHSTDVLGSVIEIISGQTLYEFLKQRIFDPLGMSSTKFALATEDELARMARPLPNDNILLAAERERLDHPEWQSGGGGLLSTITGLPAIRADAAQWRRVRRQALSEPRCLQGHDDRSRRAGLGRRTRLLLFSGRRLRLWLWPRGADRSRQRQTAAAGLARRVEMGQWQRHLFRRRSQARHGLPADAADPERAQPHHAGLQGAGLRLLSVRVTPSVNLARRNRRAALRSRRRILPSSSSLRAQRSNPDCPRGKDSGLVRCARNDGVCGWKRRTFIAFRIADAPSHPRGLFARALPRCLTLK